MSVDPVLVIDCATGEAVSREPTADEVAARAAAAVAPDDLADQAAARAAALDEVRAYAAEDPKYGALAAALGLI